MKIISKILSACFKKSWFIAIFYQECDIVLGVVLLTRNRFKLMDLSHPWTQTSIHFLIPAPGESETTISTTSLIEFLTSKVNTFFSLEFTSNAINKMMHL